MELLNSKVNHKDYMCDTTPWGAKLVDAVGSERFKLLYDIYHMQIDEGNVIATIRQYKDRIGHYHTAACPGGTSSMRTRSYGTRPSCARSPIQDSRVTSPRNSSPSATRRHRSRKRRSLRCVRSRRDNASC
jgi:sugar phosphate isomerase/epimerase